MLHIVPILCLILFIFLVEYRLNKQLRDIEKKVSCLEQANCPYKNGKSV